MKKDLSYYESIRVSLEKEGLLLKAAIPFSEEWKKQQVYIQLNEGLNELVEIIQKNLPREKLPKEYS